MIWRDYCCVVHLTNSMMNAVGGGLCKGHLHDEDECVAHQALNQSQKKI